MCVSRYRGGRVVCVCVCDGGGDCCDDVVRV